MGPRGNSRQYEEVYVRIRNFIGAVSALVLVACATKPASEPVSAPNAIKAKIRSTSFVTRDLDASVKFYTDYLGYSVLGRSEVTAPKSRQVVGATGENTVRYISLAPAEWSKETPDFAGISFVEITAAAPTLLSDIPSRASREGELILAHRVTNIEEINRRMIAGNVPIVAPLGLSGSGKSMSMAVLDPNGTRVEMYEY